jgi:hypothetical protein
VALVGGALMLTDRLLWQPGLTEDNVRRIKPGMTLAEVEVLLGTGSSARFRKGGDDHRTIPRVHPQFVRRMRKNRIFP